MLFDRMRTVPSQPPVLAPPGAGLPAPELWIGRTLFAFSRWSYNRDAATVTFLREQGLIEALIAKCHAASAGQRVLIPRLRGLEDSSRHWSVWMTLDHLRITNEAFRGVLDCLAKNITPSGAASIASVKPSPDASLEVLEEYRRSCSDVLVVIAENPNFETKVKFAHPWFGPLDAEGWHLLAGLHMSIHRKQIEAILERLA